MRVFKSKWFARFAGKKGISDDDLSEAVQWLENGQAEANLGGNVYKVRIARQGEGKSGGYRIIVLFRSGEKTFFVYGYAKSKRPSIKDDEEEAFKESAKDYFSIADEQLEKLKKHGYLIEIGSKG